MSQVKSAVKAISEAPANAGGAHPAWLFCVSQQPCDTPFTYKATGLRVYSFEEAQYTAFHYWKQSADDILSEELITWVKDALGLSYLAAKMAELSKIESYKSRLLGFLSLTDYFSKQEIKTLGQEVAKWEKGQEWEKLKERADYLMGRGEPERAVPLYRLAMQHDDNAALHNNLGVAYMKMGQYDDAYNHMAQALEISGGSGPLLLHTAEAAIYSGRFDEAAQLLSKAQNAKAPMPDIQFLHGLMHLEKKQYSKSIEQIQLAITQSKQASAGPEAYYVYTLAGVYARMRQYEKSLGILDQITDKDALFFTKQAELHAASGNYPAAAKSMQKAIFLKNNDAALWARLAAYYRMDYDWQAATGAIHKAIAIDPDNERAQLENARIKKGTGRTRDYQSVLNGILRGFKKRYRESTICSI